MVNVGVLYGGRSGEHDVSLCSAASVVKALDPRKYNVTAIGISREGKWYVQDEVKLVADEDFGEKLYMDKTGNWFVNNYENQNKLFLYDIESHKQVVIDIVFPVMHGTYCEDGTLQGLLEMAVVPYVGADVPGSSVCMDKDITKRLLRDGGVPVVDWKTVLWYDWHSSPDQIIRFCRENMHFPLFVKPARTGSSVGVRKVDSIDNFVEAMNFAMQFDSKVLIENCIDAREVECAVLGNEAPQSSVLGEIVPSHEFYSYEAKYIDPDGAALKIPAELPDPESERIRKIAVQAYKILECSSMARVDFFIDKKDGTVYLNELNTLPGFTSISMYPKLWDFSGISYSGLCDKLIDLAFEKHKLKKMIKTEI